MGYYLHYYFPDRNVRFISINDAYKNFYKDNLDSKKEILVSLDNVIDYIDLYFEEKYKKEDSEETVSE